MTRLVIYIALFACHFLYSDVWAKSLDHLSGNVPEEIYNLMLENECVPINGFYGGMVASPPFVRSRSLYSDKVTIFFVCELQSPSDSDRYKIVIIHSSNTKEGVVYTQFEHCPSAIFFKEMPGGLSLQSDQDVSSLDYNLWKSTKKWSNDKGSATISKLKSVWILDERREGGGYGFFCIEGDWYNLAYD